MFERFPAPFQKCSISALNLKLTIVIEVVETITTRRFSAILAMFRKSCDNQTLRSRSRICAYRRTAGIVRNETNSDSKRDFAPEIPESRNLLRQRFGAAQTEPE